ncbi:MAG: APC family permease [Rhodoluna sp.]|nr:APC family permease [Rhodoluna sp.]
MPKNQLRLVGAVAIGLASILGAGVFVVFREAYSISSGLIFFALGLAAITATLNAASVYRLAQAVDRPGGVYSYSRVYLNDSVSFLAGFSFVFGKIASIAAIALVFEEYVLPSVGFWPAVSAIALLTLINVMGINRTALIAAVLSLLTVTFLVATIVATASSSSENRLVEALGAQPPQVGFVAVIQAASLIFFAFAGYARVATLGSEVAKPTRNIPRAIVISLTVVIAIYFSLAFELLQKFGAGLSKAQAPVAQLARAAFSDMPLWLPVTIASLASLGSMLALLAGVSRTAATMSEDHELPKFAASRNRFGAPWVAEVFIALGAIVLVGIGDLSWVIGFSSFSVLFYYAIGHHSAFRQAKTWGFQRVFAIVGFLLCATLSAAAPGPAVPVSLAVLALALVARKLLRR